jgi:hypothetical protein
MPDLPSWIRFFNLLKTSSLEFPSQREEGYKKPQRREEKIYCEQQI